MSSVAVGTAVATSLLGRLIGSGAQRLGSLVFQKLLRTAKIDFALKGSISKNHSVQRAIDDFETVIGSRYGALDTKLFEFFRELERSGIINSMVENALLGRTSSELQQLFGDLYTKMAGSDSGAADKLFAQMMTSFNITLTELSKDKILLECIRLQRREIQVRLDLVDSALVALNRTRKSPQKSFAELQPIFVKIVKGLLSSYRHIRVETNKGARSVEITRIYIPPKLKYRETRRNTEKMAATKHVFAKLGRKHAAFLALDAHGSPIDEGLGRISYNDLRLLFTRVFGTPWLLQIGKIINLCERFLNAPTGV